MDKQINRFTAPLLIVNPVSGNGRAVKRYEEDRSTLFLLYPNLASYITKVPGDFTGIQQKIRETEPDLLIVYGGDGTVNDVINATDASIPMAIVPVGSGNDFATVLGVDRKQSIISRLEANRTVLSDLGNCNGQWFANGLGVGFDGEIARQTVSNRSIMPSFMKYYLAIFRSIFFYRESDYSISWGDDVNSMRGFESTCLMISVANGKRYGGGFHVAPLSSPVDGVLDIVTIGRVSRVLRLFYLPFIVIGKHLGLSFVKHIRAMHVRIMSDHIVPAHVDGELMLSRTYDVTIHPQKLEFVL